MFVGGLFLLYLHLISGYQNPEVSDIVTKF